MKSYRTLYTFAFLALFLVTGVAADGFAQDRAAATEAYNNAREHAGQNNFDQAISLYRQALDIANSAECEECEDIVDLIEGQLPRVYFSRAVSAFNEFRSDRSVSGGENAIQYFEEAADAGDEFGESEVSQRARSVIPQIHYQISLVHYNTEDFDSALESLATAISLNENYTLAYYQRGIVLVNSGASLNEAIAAFDEAIEVGERVGDTENVQRAQRRAGSELIYRAASHIENEQFGQALGLLQQADNYSPNSASLHYRFAEVYNNRGDYNQAIERANRALELETGGVTDQARIHFELGLAYKGLEQHSNACGAFESAAYGDFRDPALHEIEHELDCDVDDVDAIGGSS